MNLKTIAFALIIVLGFAGTTLHAQNETNSYFDIGGGLAVPQNPDEVKDYWKNGFCGGVGFGFEVMPILSIGIVGEFNRFMTDDENVTDLARQEFGEQIDGVVVDGGELETAAGWAIARLNILPMETGFNPYGVAGLGYAYYKVNEITATYQDEIVKSESKDNSGLSLAFGGGVELRFNPKFALFGEFKYVIVFANEDDTIDEDDFENLSLTGTEDDFKYTPVKFGFRFFF